MPVLRIHFIGGPFDGAYVDVPIESQLPKCWFLWRCSGDDMRDSLALRFGLVASLLPNAWSERYILSARDSGSATYLHETIKTGGPARRERSAA